MEERVRVVFLEERLDVGLLDDGAEEGGDGVTLLGLWRQGVRRRRIRVRPREYPVYARACENFLIRKKCPVFGPQENPYKLFNDNCRSISSCSTDMRILQLNLTDRVSHTN